MRVWPLGVPSMSTDSSFHDLMQRLRAGDDDAARRVFSAFSQRRIALGRSRLDGLVLQKEGAEDVAQSALKSFFLRHAEGQFEIHSWESLWGLLARITLRKCGHRVEHYRAARRDVRREAGTPEAADPGDPWAALARDPSPAEAAVFADVLRQLLRDLDDREQRIVQLTLDGYSVPEVSERVGRSEYMVRKVLKQVRARWERLCEAPAPED